MSYTITIDNILGGEAVNERWAQKNQYSYGQSISIESGDLLPLTRTNFGANPSDIPLWQVTNQKNAYTYEYCADGKVNQVSDDTATVSALNSGTALTSAAGNGAEYYDNYIYLAKNTDVCRYGPLNGSPSFTQNYWTSTLAKTALNDTTYPTLNGYEIPNHPMYTHSDGKVYFGDVTSGNVGIVNYIETSKTSVEGDTNAGSTYNALDLPYGYYPTTISGYGTDLVVGVIDGTSLKRPAKIIFWDTTSGTYTQIIDKELSDPLITAIKNVNGRLYVFSGNSSETNISTFAGGYTLRPGRFIDYVAPPFQGQVTFYNNRLHWNSGQYSFSMGTISGLVSSNALVTHYDVANTVLGALSIYGAVQTYEPKLLLSQKLSGTVTRYEIKEGAAFQTQSWVSQVYKIGRPFQVKSIAIQTNGFSAYSITPSMIIDGSATQITAMNTTNYPGGSRYYKNLDSLQNGKYSLQLKLDWATSCNVSVMLPIIIEIETIEDAQG